MEDGWITSQNGFLAVRLLIDGEVPVPVAMHSTRPDAFGIESNTDFTVQVRSFRRHGPKICTLSIDGKRVAAMKGEKKRQLFKFTGFKESSDSFLMFRTCSLPPSMDSSSNCSSHSNSASIGRLHVDVTSALSKGKRRPPRKSGGGNGSGGSASQQHVPPDAKGASRGDKKFFESASLAVGAGKQVTRPLSNPNEAMGAGDRGSMIFKPTSEWRDVLSLEYDQMAHLRLRGYKFLQDESTLPVDLSRFEDEAEGDDAQADSDSGHSSSSAPSSVNRKRKASAFVDCIEFIDHYDLTQGDEVVHSIAKRQRTLEQVLDLL